MSESAPSLFRLVVLATDRKRDGMKEECLRITDRDVAELVSKIELQTDAKTARQRERGAGEQTGEVDDVESVSEIEDVGLNAKLLPVGLEQDRAERRVDRCGRANTPLRKVHVSDDPGTVLGQCLRGIAVEFDRQPAAVGSSNRRPRAFRQLIRDAATQRVALILRNRERLRRRQRRAGFVAQEESASNGEVSRAMHIRVTDEPGPRVRPRDVQLDFRSTDLRSIESDWKAHPGVQQQIVVREVVHAPPVLRDVDAGDGEQAFREPRLEEVT